MISKGGQVHADTSLTKASRASAVKNQIVALHHMTSIEVSTLGNINLLKVTSTQVEILV